VLLSLWKGHPEFVKQFARLLGARVEGTEGQKLLMICGDYMEGECITVSRLIQIVGVDLKCSEAGQGL
jgi:hypothetical protein